MNIDGVWRLRFFNIERGQLANECGGIARLESGHLSGGDAWSSYDGIYTISENLVTFHLRVLRNHGAGAHYFFGPVPEVLLTAKGLIDQELQTIEATTVLYVRSNSTLMSRFDFISRLPHTSSPALNGREVNNETAGRLTVLSA